MKRAESGQAPKPPLGPEGRRFRFNNNSGEQKGSYTRAAHSDEAKVESYGRLEATIMTIIVAPK